jgi:hypothetical protein
MHNMKIGYLTEADRQKLESTGWMGKKMKMKGRYAHTHGISVKESCSCGQPVL